MVTPLRLPTCWTTSLALLARRAHSVAMAPTSCAAVQVAALAVGLDDLHQAVLLAPGQRTPAAGGGSKLLSPSCRRARHCRRFCKLPASPGFTPATTSFTFRLPTSITQRICWPDEAGMASARSGRQDTGGGVGGDGRRRGRWRRAPPVRTDARRRSIPVPGQRGTRDEGLA